MVENLKRYIFTTYGRLNRERFIKYGLAWFALTSIVAVILVFISTMLFGEQSFITNAVTAILSVIGFFGNIALIIRRLHDLNRPEWWAIGIIIPIIGLLLALYLLFVPGTPGRNQYGDDPRWQ